MTDDPAAFIPIWMLLSAAFGFIIGEACGDNFRHRKCLEQANDDLREEHANPRLNEKPLLRELRQQRGEINDIHKQILAVSKAPQKRPS